MTPVNSLGYGVVGVNVTVALSQIAEIGLWPIGNPDWAGVQEQVDIQPLLTAMQRQSEWSPVSPCLRIWHEFQLSESLSKTARMAFPFFEIDSFDTRRINHLAGQDLVFVASEWAKNVIHNHDKLKDLPCEVVELGVNREIFHAIEVAPHDNTVFLNVGKFSINKGHDVLVEVFNKAFEQKDNVELWLVCENPFCTETETNDWHKLYKESKLGSKVRIFPRMQSQRQLAKLMQVADCGVFLSRGEAWNLEVLEMMSCGKPSIVTNYGGHTQYCNDTNSLLVNTYETEAAYDGKFFNGDVGSWAALNDKSIDEAASLMSLFHIFRREKSYRNNVIETATKLSWTNTAEKILNALRNYGT